jgi:hypothetical protein
MKIKQHTTGIPADVCRKTMELHNGWHKFSLCISEKGCTFAAII